MLCSYTAATCRFASVQLARLWDGMNDFSLREGRLSSYENSHSSPIHRYCNNLPLVA